MVSFTFRATLAAAAIALAASATATPRLTKIFYNPPGTDDGTEFIEVTGNPGEALTGVSIVYLDGDSGAGVIKNAVNLTTQTCGTNGVLLVRDSAIVLSPAPAAGTNVFVDNFTPDMENGSNTVLLVSNFSGAVAQDLDTAKDGTLDSTPWTSVIDAVGFLENDTGVNISYAAAFGGTVLGPFTASFNPDVVVRTQAGWFGSDVLGTSPGPFTVDSARNSNATYGASSPTILPGTPGSFSAVSDWNLY